MKYNFNRKKQIRTAKKLNEEFVYDELVYDNKQQFYNTSINNDSSDNTQKKKETKKSKLKKRAYYNKIIKLTKEHNKTLIDGYDENKLLTFENIFYISHKFKSFYRFGILKFNLLSILSIFSYFLFGLIHSLIKCC